MKDRYKQLILLLAMMISSPLLFSQVEILSPNGGEEFTVNDVVSILWTGTTKKELTTLEVSSDRGSSWETIAENQTENRFLWRIPNSMKTNDNYLLRVKTEDFHPMSIVLDTNFFVDNQAINTIDINFDGRLAAISAGNDIIVWDLKNHVQVSRLTHHTDRVYFIRFSPDGSKLVSSSADGTAVIWDVLSSSRAHVLDVQMGIMWRAVFSPDGTTVATAPDNGSLILWNVETGQQLKTYEKLHKEAIRFLQYTSDGKRILTSSTDRTAGIVDIQTGEFVLQVEHHQNDVHTRDAIVNGIQLTPDNSVLITCGYDGWVKFWNAQTGELIRARNDHMGEHVISIRLSHDGRWMTSVGYDGRTMILNPYTGDMLAELTLNTPEKVVPMLRSAFASSPEKKVIAITHLDGQVSFWDWEKTTVTGISDSLWSIKACDNLGEVQNQSVDVNSNHRTLLDLR